jgi:hypothetical protein
MQEEAAADVLRLVSGEGERVVEMIAMPQKTPMITRVTR